MSAHTVAVVTERSSPTFTPLWNRDPDRDPLRLKPMNNDEDLVGLRYLRWSKYVEPNLTTAQRAEALDDFATEFDAVPRDLEPFAGWGEFLANSCRRLASRCRGEDPGPWTPEWEHAS